jgi:polyhydroxyalkanoate synthesis regulator phasin
MNSDNLTQLLQQGFRVTLGATTSLVETLQDPQKRNDNLDSIRSELSHIATEWAAKGEITEQEARNFVDNFLNQLGNQGSSPTSASPPATVTVTSTQAVPSGVELELQELTAQIAAIRTELEKLRNSDSNPS